MGLKDSPNTNSTGDIWSVVISYLGRKVGFSSGVWGGSASGHTYGWIAPTLCFNVGYAASLTDRGEFGLVLLFSGWVTCGHRIPPLSLIGCVYRMEEVIQPTPVEKTRNQVHTALPYLCLCQEYPRLALNSKGTTHASLVPSVSFLLCCESVQRKSPTPPILPLASAKDCRKPNGK